MSYMSKVQYGSNNSNRFGNVSGKSNSSAVERMRQELDKKVVFAQRVIKLAEEFSDSKTFVDKLLKLDDDVINCFNAHYVNRRLDILLGDGKSEVIAYRIKLVASVIILLHALKNVNDSAAVEQKLNLYRLITWLPQLGFTYNPDMMKIDEISEKYGQLLINNGRHIEDNVTLYGVQVPSHVAFNSNITIMDTYKMQQNQEIRHRQEKQRRREVELQPQKSILKTVIEDGDVCLGSVSEELLTHSTDVIGEMSAGIEKLLIQEYDVELNKPTARNIIIKADRGKSLAEINKYCRSQVVSSYPDIDGIGLQIVIKSKGELFCILLKRYDSDRYVTGAGCGIKITDESINNKGFLDVLRDEALNRINLTLGIKNFDSIDDLELSPAEREIRSGISRALCDIVSVAVKPQQVYMCSSITSSSAHNVLTAIGVVNVENDAMDKLNSLLSNDFTLIKMVKLETLLRNTENLLDRVTVYGFRDSRTYEDIANI